MHLAATLNDAIKVFPNGGIKKCPTGGFATKTPEAMMLSPLNFVERLLSSRPYT
jgi:hypothetical protein